MRRIKHCNNVTWSKIKLPTYDWTSKKTIQGICRTLKPSPNYSHTIYHMSMRITAVYVEETLTTQIRENKQRHFIFVAWCTEPIECHGLYTPESNWKRNSFVSYLYNHTKYVQHLQQFLHNFSLFNKASEEVFIIVECFQEVEIINVESTTPTWTTCIIISFVFFCLFALSKGWTTDMHFF